MFTYLLKGYQTMICKALLNPFLTILVLATIVLCPGMARADLTITPVRVVFEGRDRSATVELINTTNKTNTYRMRWMEMKMGPSGRYELIPADDKDPNSVANMVIFSPRQVTIEPHGQQTIRLSLRRPADLPDGEYRAHLGMVRLAKQGPERPNPNAKGVEMDMRVNLGFSIPVIVRAGNDKDLKISLINPKLEMSPDPQNPTPVLKIDLHRDSGKFSAYGQVTVYWTPSKGSEKIIGNMANMALYPELETRPIMVPLKENPDSGTLRIVYAGKYESDGKTWAEKILPIGK
ncbi:MAG: hypothetical protein JWO78_1072 [Micavibrio sp.]|nr:hypothetical protein [Micavibrio sp.]